MSVCDYCGNVGAGLDCLHVECNEEWQRRYRNDECVKCGAAAKKDDLWCNSCGVDSPYQNYPGNAK